MLSVTTAVFIYIFKLMIIFFFWNFIPFCNVRTGKSYLWYIKIPPEILYIKKYIFFCVLLCSLLWSVLFYFYFLVKIKIKIIRRTKKKQAAKRLTAVRLQRGHKATKKTTNACKVGNWNFAGDNVINMLISSRCFYLKCHNW